MKLLAKLSMFLLVLAANIVSAAGEQRPNILWIIVEDMSANMSCYGEKTIQTPNIDRIAREGVLFKKAFVTAPVCSPSRSALITGMYQTSIGAHNHRSSRGKAKIHLPPHVKMIPEFFRDAGYYTVLGRMASNAAPRNNEQLGKSDYNFVWNESVYDSGDWSGRKPGQPFFAQINLSGGKFRQAKVPNPVDPASVNLPPYYPDHPVLREDWARYLNSVLFTDIQVGQLLKRLEDEGILDDTVIFFFTDHGISHARDKQFCYDGGMHIPLLVRWPAKLKAGSVRDDLVEHIDIAASSLDIAGLPIPKHMEARPLFSKAAKPRDHVICARDRCDETVDRIRAVRDDRYKYIRNYYPDRSHMQPNRYKDQKPPIVALRELHAKGQLTPAQSRIFQPTRPNEELYDLRDDPYELNNLASSPAHEKTLKKMRGILDKWIKQTGDQGQFAEPKESYEEAERAR